MFAFFLLALIGSVSAGCDNSCSGHGTCGTNGVCECYDNWGLGLSHNSGDCSERICPYEFAWVDTPDVEGVHHKYAECASKGVCDRDSGACVCFPGYEGKACQRTTCPNQCSGHGQCEYIENMVFAANYWDYVSHDATLITKFGNEDVDIDTGDDTYFTAGTDASLAPASYFYADRGKRFMYTTWDKKKTRGCVCDPEYGDVDCSKRMCPFGNDVMDHRMNLAATQRFQTQRIQFTAVDSVNSAFLGASFALTFKSQLNETFTTSPIKMAADTAVAQNLLDMSAAIKSALENLPNKVIDSVSVVSTQVTAAPANAVKVDITFDGAHNEGAQHLLNVVSYHCGDGCTPKVDGLVLVPGQHLVREVWKSVIVGSPEEGRDWHTADFNSYECGRRGKCDYDSGVCECFEGYTGIACNTISALV